MVKLNDAASGRALGAAAAVKGLIETITAGMTRDEARAFADRAQLSAQRLINQYADQMGPDAQFGAQEALRLAFSNLDLPTRHGS